MLCPHCFLPTDKSSSLRCSHCGQPLEETQNTDDAFVENNDDVLSDSQEEPHSFASLENHNDEGDNSQWMRIEADDSRNAHDYCRCPEDDHGKILHSSNENATPSHSSDEKAPAQKPSSKAVALQDVNTYLMPAILTSLFCCIFPSGVMSIYHAIKVNACQSHRDLNGALLHSRKAKNWIIASVVLSIIFWFIALIAEK